MLAAGAADLLGCATVPGKPGASSIISYFSRFGVTEPMVRDTLATAMSRGGEYADLFVQYRVANSLGLEDGAVNRASSSVSLGAGVRVVKGDQTGYGYTEDLSLEALRECARTAAAIADGPSRSSPTPRSRFGSAGLPAAT